MLFGMADKGDLYYQVILTETYTSRSVKTPGPETETRKIYGQVCTVQRIGKS